MFRKWMNLFRLKHKKWMKMSVDRMFFEANTERYFMILKAAGKSGGESVTLTVGNIFEESVLNNLVQKNGEVKGIFRQLGLKIKKIQLVRKVNSKDSALVSIDIGWIRKKIRTSSVEAVKLAMEFGQVLEVPVDIVKAEQYDLSGYVHMAEKAENNLFSPKFIERESYFNHEVIM